MGNTIMTILLYSKAFVKFNWTPEMTALVIPHPKQLTPKIFLTRQIVGCLFNQSSGTINKPIGKRMYMNTRSFVRKLINFILKESN